jgi:PAS domain S-box-containing protein
MTTDVPQLEQECAELDHLRALNVTLEERLRAAERAAAGATTLIQAVNDSAPVGLGLIDRDLRFLQVNEALARMNEATVAEHVGRPMKEVALVTWSELAPVCRSVLRTGEPVVNLEIGADPNVAQCGSWLNTVYPVRVGDEIVGLACLVVDITADARAEEFRAVITETMVDGLLALDAAGHITFANAAASRMLGWSDEELLTRNLHDTIRFQQADGTPASRDDCRLEHVRGEGQPVHSVDDTFTRLDGTLLPVTYSAAPLVNAEHGCGVVVVFRDATERRAEQERAQRDLDTVHWLGRTREAIDENRLVLYSQPIVALGDDLPSEELLLRMIGRDGEVIPPAAFLPIAEQYGLIAEIDHWVIAQAARLAAEGRRVNLNLSAKSIDARLLGYIESELREAGADPADVIIELTETALMADITAGEEFARGLADIGCRLALDDFGTGFGSLANLKVLPAQYLKIDIEFVRDLATNETNQHLVKTIVSLARGLDQKTVAEGVEDERTLALLYEYGVDFAQGYHLGRPAPMTSALLAGLAPR